MAIDVEQKMLVYNRHELEQLELADRSEFIQAKPGDPLLPDHSVDLICMCNTYHHLDHHVEYSPSIKHALTTNGRAGIVDLHHDERSGKLGFSKHHLVPREQVIMHMQQAR